MRGRAAALYGLLLILGLSWGLVIPMAKVALDAGRPVIGMIAWQVAFMALALTAVLLARGRPLPAAPRHWAMFAVIALTGTLIPNLFSFRATAELPAGVMSIIVALVPMAALPMALTVGLERWRPSRLGGVALGAVAVGLLAAPDAGLPAADAWVWILLGLVAPVCYAVEGVYLGWRGTHGLDALEVLWGASLVAVALAVPWAVAAGAWIDPFQPWTRAEWAILVAAASHAGAYAGYIWLVGQAGAVFSAQVAYVVTAAGVLWSMTLLEERYSIWVWAAFALMLAGLALVQPGRGPAAPRPEEA